MKTTSFWREVLLAVVISVVGAVVHNVLVGFIGRALSLRLVVLLVALVYVLSLLRQSPLTSGRVVGALGWVALSGLLIVFNPALSVWLLLETAFIWLLRGLQSYDSPISAGIDALLSAFALAAAVTTALHTQSLFLSLWCFFLVQSLTAFVPRRAPERSLAAGLPETDFDASFRNAEAALRRLSVRT